MMDSNSLTSCTYSKSRMKEGRKGDNTKLSTNAAFVAQMDEGKKPTSDFKSKPTRGGGKDGPSVEEKRNKVYSFRRDKIMKIFNDAMKSDLQLPEPKRPGEVGKIDDPNYCPYHRLVSHLIEDCYIFKDWIEKNTKKETLDSLSSSSANKLNMPT